jgi:hypothetical protein
LNPCSWDQNQRLNFRDYGDLRKLTKNNLFKEKSVSKKKIRREKELREQKRRKEGSLTQMKRTINSPTGFSPVEKEKRTTSPTMHRTSSQSSLISTSSLVRRELDRALAFKVSKWTNERSNHG